MPAGEVTVGLANQDLFWHTFTIEELGVDLPVPVGASLTVTFDASPGNYRFICPDPRTSVRRDGGEPHGHWLSPVAPLA